jgi:hypothetical protein
MADTKPVGARLAREAFRALKSPDFKGFQGAIEFLL